ncbi:MAG: trehalose-phosphatase [Burkholderiaceae bacterium]|nr:trehalose-phosphatase [Rhodoferax sp.]MCP5284945.1 trehalose-phosphatase [Burkholderiaceae bacterium]
MPCLPPLPADAALFLDFDGTLADIAPRPEAVSVAPAVLQALAALQEHLGGALAVISGRPVAQIDHHLHPLRVPAAGQHGAERRDAQGLWHRVPLPALAPVLPPLQALVLAHPALVLEVKTAALAIHWRGDPAQADACRAAMRAGHASVPGMSLMEGKMVMELKPAAADKGRALQAFMAEAPFAGRMPWFFGDDVTDEAGFAAVQALGGVAVKVGGGDSAAPWRLPDPAALRAWLAAVVTEGAA